MAVGAWSDPEISCRITRTLIMYVRETNGSLGDLLTGLPLSESYLTDTNNWVSHAFLHILYARMIDILRDPNAVYHMALASDRFRSLGLLEWMARLLGNPGVIYGQAPKYNRLLKSNGDVIIRGSGEDWVLLEDRYHDGSRKTRLDCDYTRGILTGIPTLFDMPPARVEEVECQVTRDVYGKRVWLDTPSYGSKGCLYRVQWEAKARPPLAKRLFQRYNAYRHAVDDLLETNRVVQEKYEEVKKLALELEAANRQLKESKRQLENHAAELKASEHRYRLLAENVTDTIWTLSLESLRFTYISPSIQRMRGHTVDESMAIPLSETLTPESMERVSAILAEELAKETDGKADPDRSRTIEIEQYRKDGSILWTETRASFLRDEKGKVVGLLGMSRDISERREAERLNRARIAAEAASAAKSRFLANMSHELRTPLNHMMGFTELILGKNFGELNETQEEYLSDVYRSSQHLLSLVNDILDLSKIEAGRLELSLSNIQLKPLLEKSLSIIADKAGLKKIRLAADIDPVVATITADERRLNQIMYNLLSNAVKFTGDGGTISLNARLISGTSRDAQSGQEVEIGVADTGIGIRPEDLTEIFNPFSQVEGALSRKYPGTGLGLGLSRNLVEMHGGRIWAESGGPGKGSVFRFTLPLRQPPPEK